MSTQVIFVFGSNQLGVHGAGAAKEAVQYWGARPGVGVGLQGNSYAIPTKDKKIQTLPLHRIKQYIAGFIDCAEAHPDLEFQVTAVGCGLAGYHAPDIAPAFSQAPKNCILPPSFRSHVAGDHQFRDHDLVPRIVAKPVTIPDAPIARWPFSHTKPPRPPSKKSK
jgi:hypothetical protein